MHTFQNKPIPIVLMLYKANTDVVSDFVAILVVYTRNVLS